MLLPEGVREKNRRMPFESWLFRSILTIETGEHCPLLSWGWGEPFAQSLLISHLLIHRSHQQSLNFFFDAILFVFECDWLHHIPDTLQTTAISRKISIGSQKDVLGERISSSAWLEDYQLPLGPEWNERLSGFLDRRLTWSFASPSRSTVTTMTKDEGEIALRADQWFEHVLLSSRRSNSLVFNRSTNSSNSWRPLWEIWMTANASDADWLWQEHYSIIASLDPFQ